MKPFPNRTSTFQRIRLSPDRWSIHLVRYARLVRTEPRSSLRPAEALRPAAALPAAPVGRDPHGYYGLSAPVPALVISRPTIAGAGSGSGVARVVTTSCRRCPFDPLTWRTTLGTSRLGCKAALAPALPYPIVRLRGWLDSTHKPASFPSP